LNQFMIHWLKKYKIITNTQKFWNEIKNCTWI
jgi:hypothetical protein